MKRLVLACIALAGVGAAAVFSDGRDGFLKTFFPKEERNPVTHLRWNDDPADFQFAIVSDRTGGHRPEIFSQAVEKLNLLQPAFVLSVGDLIEGGPKPQKTLAAEWTEFDGFVNKLNMPFFYAPGNHDVASKEAAKFWQGKLGRRYYHFVYRNVLFLILNADDPPGSRGNIGSDQLAYAQKALKDNPGVRWTIVSIHRPLWLFADGAKNGWSMIEKSLAGRPYTVFCGHEHTYVKFVRHGMNYYQLATTGGDSLMRGVDQGEIDHIVWVTMKKNGPLLANILIDSVYAENLQKVKTVEPGVSTAKHKPTYPARGTVFCEGVPTPGAVVTLEGVKSLATSRVKAVGVVEADASFRLSTYTAFDGAPAGDYRVSVTWQDPRTGKNLLSAKYASPATSDLRCTIKAGSNEMALELKK